MLDDAFETPLGHDLDGNFNEFAAVLGMVFGAFCLAYFSSHVLQVLQCFFYVLLKENLMNKPCVIDGF